ncbi:MAG TPA: CsbD family protein [Aliidongia sp.]|uniref:CsbD family protein n=1 Tax=Aliidongia sp. TaxID=1914230 RepID=UPI002DDD81F8|nr:CsbD family protein [Aliidongia sp.]HEV2673171.1 CsbD family protein [Aliidongia sp.]
MEDNTVIGAAKRVAGRVESSVGALAGDTRTEVRGKVREFGGTVQQRYGEATDSARDLIGSRSLAALLAAGAVGLVFGLFLNRR